MSAVTDRVTASDIQAIARLLAIVRARLAAQDHQADHPEDEGGVVA